MDNKTNYSEINLSSYFYDIAHRIVLEQNVNAKTIKRDCVIGHHHFLTIMETMDKIGITRKDKDLEKWDVLIKSEHELNELIRHFI